MNAPSRSRVIKFSAGAGVTDMKWLGKNLFLLISMTDLYHVEMPYGQPRLIHTNQIQEEELFVVGGRVLLPDKDEIVRFKENGEPGEPWKHSYGIDYIMYTHGDVIYLAHGNSFSRFEGSTEPNKSAAAREWDEYLILSVMDNGHFALYDFSARQYWTTTFDTFPALVPSGDRHFHLSDGSIIAERGEKITWKGNEYDIGCSIHGVPSLFKGILVVPVKYIGSKTRWLSPEIFVVNGIASDDLQSVARSYGREVTIMSKRWDIADRVLASIRE